MSVCIVHQRGAIVLHRHMTTKPATFLPAIAPSREGLVVAVEWLFPWDWLADRCADAGLPCVLGHALSLTALQGGPAKNDQSDAPKSAALLRGGTLPQADVSPAQRRAPRALLRRRRPLAHPRAARFAPGPQTNSQDTLPALGTQSADTATRAGGAARCAAPAGQKSLAVALARLPADDALRRDVARPLVHPATPHDAPPRSLLPTVPGLGHILRLVRRYASPASHRLPSVQDGVASCRRVTCAKAAGGKRLGTSGTKSGQAPLTGAFSAAAGLCLRDQPAAHKDRARLEKKQATGNAVTLLAQPLARAVSSRLPRPGACEREPCFPPSGRGAAAPAASLAPQGVPLAEALTPAACTASVHAPAPLGHETRRPALCLDRRFRSCWPRRSSRTACVGGSSPAPGAHGTTLTRCARSVQRTVRGHREMSRSQRAHRRGSARGAPAPRAPQYGCGAAPDGLRRPPELTSEHATVC